MEGYHLVSHKRDSKVSKILCMEKRKHFQNLVLNNPIFQGRIEDEEQMQKAEGKGKLARDRPTRI